MSVPEVYCIKPTSLCCDLTWLCPRGTRRSGKNVDIGFLELFVSEFALSESHPSPIGDPLTLILEGHLISLIWTGMWRKPPAPSLKPGNVEVWKTPS